MVCRGGFGTTVGEPWVYGLVEMGRVTVSVQCAPWHGYRLMLVCGMVKQCWAGPIPRALCVMLAVYVVTGGGGGGGGCHV